MFVLALALAPASAFASTPKSGLSEAYLSTFEALAPVELDPTKTATVQSRLLVRDRGSFSLQDGSLTVCKPIGGHVRAAVFVGTGTFTFTPPNSIERGQIERFFKTRILQVPFRSLVLFFADSTESELSDLTFAAQAPTTKAKDALALTMKYVLDRREKEWVWADPSLIRTLLDDSANGYFFAHVGREKGEQLVWTIDQFRGEQVSLEPHDHTSRVGMQTHHSPD